MDFKMLTEKDKRIVQITIDAIWNNQEPPRLVQIFDKTDVVEEWCVHGVKLRWSCDKCEELEDIMGGV